MKSCDKRTIESIDFFSLSLLSNNLERFSIISVTTRLSRFFFMIVIIIESVGVPFCPLDFNWINTPGWMCELRCAWFRSVCDLLLHHYPWSGTSWWLKPLNLNLRQEVSYLERADKTPTIDSANLTVLSNTLWDSADITYPARTPGTKRLRIPPETAKNKSIWRLIFLVLVAF